MTNVKLEIVCEFEGKRYRFVETTRKEYNEANYCKNKCSFYQKGLGRCPRIITVTTRFPICNGVNYGHWEEIK